jgi:hypothetical protein
MEDKPIYTSTGRQHADTVSCDAMPVKHSKEQWTIGQKNICVIL